MSKWGWLPTSLSERPEVFGEFNGCLAFESVFQRGTAGSSNLTTSLPTPPNNRTLSSEHEVYVYLNDLGNVHSLQYPQYITLSLIISTRPSRIAFTNHTLGMNGKLPLPISRILFEHVTQVFDISTTYLTVLNTGLATYTSTVQAGNREDGRERENAQFVIQQNRAYSAFSIAITFGLRTGKTRVLIFGVEPSSLSELFAYLHSLSPQPYGPMVIPIVAMELQAQGLGVTIKNCQDRIHSVEIATGMRQFNYLHERKSTSTQDWKSLDLISVTRDLSGFLSRFAFLKMQAETGAYLVQQMARTTESLIVRSGKGQTLFDIDDQYDILSKLEHVHSWFLGIAARCRYLSERTAAQSQTVNCLIASQDNLTNIEIARASHNIAEGSHRETEAMRIIAELSHRDNELMIQVAKDSRAVAVATAQDSAAMQVIAAVTILFLPATFTATFFSMTFFDFLDADRPYISPWSWIYVLVTVILTVVIQVTWAVISKRKRAKITQATAVRL
ncbi:putative Mg2+ transporter -like Zinc transport protein [Rosellinia necatrix]|uniref:Putative Mg2+ transporter-like Zinc transport protein n=1 Tax=Rosellinia necatrix TaxID=77044 RepID=A0A1S8A4P1_ROSNE|nr:putative Mg2+ transporter -like Zinc transport protein [Rosellinia necatrix]